MGIGSDCTDTSGIQSGCFCDCTFERTCTSTATVDDTAEAEWATDRWKRYTLPARSWKPSQAMRTTPPEDCSEPSVTPTSVGKDALNAAAALGSYAPLYASH